MWREVVGKVRGIKLRFPALVCRSPAYAGFSRTLPRMFLFARLLRHDCSFLLGRSYHPRVI